MDQLDKIRDAVVNNKRLTESSLRQMIGEFVKDNNTSGLLSALCSLKSQIDGQWYTLYKITVIVKHLCAQDPKELSSFLSKQTAVLHELKHYTHLDNFGVDQGANIRVNVQQLLDFVAEKKLPDQKGRVGTHRSFNASMDSAIDHLLDTLDSISSINSDKISQKLLSDINQLNKYLPGPVTSEKYTDLDNNPQIDATLYGKLVERIVDYFDDNFPNFNGKLDPTIERFIIVQGATFLMFHESLVALTDALKRSTSDKVTNSLVILLEKLMKSESMFSAITDVCKNDEKTAIEREEMESKWQSTLQIIVSLPTRVANKLNGKIPNSFTAETYAKIMYFHIARSIAFFNSCLTGIDNKPDLKMISMLVSKAVITLGSQRFEALIDIMSEWCSGNSENLQILVNKILRHIDRRAMEPIAILFLKRSDPVDGIERAFENLLLNPHWKHVFTIKIPLMAYHESENLVRNLIAYLSSSSNDKRILTDLVLRLLDIWGDKSALNHTSLDQHVYITKLILIAMRKLKGTLSKNEKSEIKRLLFSGTSIHLESAQSELRGIGMITGEIVIEVLNDSEDEPKLKYDYQGMPEKTRRMVEELRYLESTDCKSAKVAESKNVSFDGETKFENKGEKRIFDLAVDCGILSRRSIESGDTSKATNELKLEEKDVPRRVEAATPDPEESLDSDDDLVPYDMSNDTSISEKLRPTYLRDMRDNLLNSQASSDPNVFAQSMEAAEDLILSQLPNDDSSFAIELLEIFVTLRENSYLENFELLKHRACVSIVMVFPKESAKYLCKEFHAKVGDYSIKDRLFILDVLGESARRLSKIEAKTSSPVATNESRHPGKRSAPKKISLAIDSTNVKKHETLYDDDFEISPASSKSTIDWQEIVDKRIQSNTRRFAHPTKMLSTTINKFNDVASSFFYPLLYGFRREGTCMYNTPKNFEDQENILLVNYLKTLSKIMMAAENCIAAPKMAKEMMELAWSLRYHEQAKVRLCIIENIASVVVTLPKQGLTQDLMELIFEFRAWLSDVSDDGVRGDPDSECRSLGRNVVGLIDSIFHSTLQEYTA